MGSHQNLTAFLYSETVCCLLVDLKHLGFVNKWQTF
nr:MAG TPA: hypothetical protein [Caudoviricetes sp.]